MDKQKQKEKQILKKILIITGIVTAAVIALTLILWLIMSLLGNKKIQTRVVDETIRFADVNYSVDIFNDPIYNGKERNITKCEFGETITIGSEYNGDEADWHGIAPESVYEKEGAEVVFFRNYFICLISGNYKAYPSFFTDNFFKYYSIPKKFTAQKIYAPSIEIYNREEITYGDGTAVVSSYIVRYKIMNNNGSFRGDVASDTVKPLYIKLIKYRGEVKIESVSFLKEKKD